MGLLNDSQRRPGILRLLIIQLLCWFAWFSSFCFAQFDLSEGVTGSVNFPTLGIACVGNLAVFVTSLIRGRLDLEIGARDVVNILASPKLINIPGTMETGLTTTSLVVDGYLNVVSVVMLSNGTPNSSIKEFVKSNANYVDSILLQFFPLKVAANSLGAAAVTVEMCPCASCHCIIFRTVENITNKLARRMPGTLRPLADPALCLLPCVTCLEKGCHGCNRESMLHGGGHAEDEGQSVVSHILEDIRAGSIPAGKPICICIPLKDARGDTWTELLVRSLRSKDAEGRGARVMASEALEGYLQGRGAQEGKVEYHIASFIVPRLTEMLINLALTFWFRVDGFSSSLVARRTVRDYLVDSKGNGFAANAFLFKAVVKSNANNTQICQVLSFRGNLVDIKCLSFVVASVNLISSIGWVLLIVFKGRADISPPLSIPRIAVIITTIGIALVVDVAIIAIVARDSCTGYFSQLRYFVRYCVLEWYSWHLSYFKCVIILEILCIVSGSVVAGTMGVKAFGTWVYGVLQTLVWMKWGIGSYGLEYKNAEEFFGRNYYTEVTMVYSSAFFLNAVLAGVRCDWEPWPWKGDSKEFMLAGTGN